MASTRLNKKQDILQAATVLFAEQGFHSTTAIQISKEAGITEPMIYYHFQGKNELFTGIVASTFERFYARLGGPSGSHRHRVRKKSRISLPCISISSKRMPSRFNSRSDDIICLVPLFGGD